MSFEDSVTAGIAEALITSVDGSQCSDSEMGNCSDFETVSHASSVEPFEDSTDALDPALDTVGSDFHELVCESSCPVCWRLSATVRCAACVGRDGRVAQLDHGISGARAARASCEARLRELRAAHPSASRAELLLRRRQLSLSQQLAQRLRADTAQLKRQLRVEDERQRELKRAVKEAKSKYKKSEQILSVMRKKLGHHTAIAERQAEKLQNARGNALLILQRVFPMRHCSRSGQTDWRFQDVYELGGAEEDGKMKGALLLPCETPAGGITAWRPHDLVADRPPSCELGGACVLHRCGAALLEVAASTNSLAELFDITLPHRHILHDSIPLDEHMEDTHAQAVYRQLCVNVAYMCAYAGHAAALSLHSLMPNVDRFLQDPPLRLIGLKVPPFSNGVPAALVEEMEALPPLTGGDGCVEMSALCSSLDMLETSAYVSVGDMSQ